MSSAGARRPRQITPTSPSPSPEPQSHTGANGAGATKTSQPAPALPPAQAEASAAIESADPTESVRAALETRVRAVVDLLYQLAVCSADVQEGSQHLVANKVNECIKALAELDATKDELHRAHLMVPQEVLEMLDAGKNPDTHTRNFISRLASENQYSYGQHNAVSSYKDALDAALDQAFPELAGANKPAEAQDSQ